MAWFSFIELDKAVVLVWSDWLVFCDYGFIVSVFWCPLATPTMLLRFLLPWTWGISSWLLQQSSAGAPYLGRGLSPYGRSSWPWRWSSSSRPSCTTLGQTTNREWVRHPSADNWIKALLSKALPTKATPSFSHHQSFITSLPKPLSPSIRGYRE